MCACKRDPMEPLDSLFRLCKRPLCGVIWPQSNHSHHSWSSTLGLYRPRAKGEGEGLGRRASLTYAANLTYAALSVNSTHLHPLLSSTHTHIHTHTSHNTHIHTPCSLPMSLRRDPAISLSVYSLNSQAHELRLITLFACALYSDHHTIYHLHIHTL
jgi:hypothetical protein